MLRIPSWNGFCAALILLPFIFSIAGCGTSATKDSPNATPATASSKTGPQSQPANSVNAADADVSEELAKLPPEDLALAKKQKVCPVTDAPLGSMGTPVKVNVKGRDVFLCCVGCKDRLLKNPDKYLAKLDKQDLK